MNTLQRLEKDDGYLLGSLIRLHALQTEPGNRENWLYGSDIGILGSFVSYFQKRGSLTPAQMDWLRRAMKKYAATLETLTIENVYPKVGLTSSPVATAAKVSEAWLDGKRIRVSFPYSPDLVEKCKTIYGHHWEASDRTWDFPLCLETVDTLRDLGFAVTEALQSWYVDMKSPVNLDLDLNIPGLGGKLRHFQKEGVAFIEAKKGRALIGDDMGLGKTPQALAYLQLHPEIRPAIVICPACVKINWEREATKWTTENTITVLRGLPKRKDFDEERLSGIVIINYDILSNRSEKDDDGKKHPIKFTGWVDWLKLLNPKIIIIDEIQYIVSRKASRTKAVLSLCRGVKQVVGLSGTPIENRPVELYTSIHLINPTIFPSFFSYAMKYCGAKNNVFGWEYTGSSNTLELNNILKSTCIPYDTMLYLESGPMCIGKVVENSIKERILCYDTVSGTIQWGQIEAHGAFEKPDRMVRISHEFGKFDCTADHKVWTKEKGYIRAEEVTPDLSLLVVSWRKDHYTSRSIHLCPLLHNKMCRRTQRKYRNCDSKKNKSPMGRNHNQISRKEVSVLPKNNTPFSAGITTGEKILLCKMLPPMVCRTSDPRYDRRMEECGTQALGEIECNIRKGTTCTKGSWIKEKRTSCTGRTEIKNVRITKNQVVQNKKRRQKGCVSENITTRNNTAQSTELAEGIFGVSDCDQQNGGSNSERCSVLSLCGHSLPRQKNSNRNRWSHTQHKKAETQRYLEGERTEESRVVSVEIYQSRSGRKSKRSSRYNKVYDIQVQKTNNYFANGCLVHNCMIRRRKQDVLKELPPKTRSIVPMEIDNVEEYLKAKGNFLQWLAEYGASVDESGGRITEMAQLEKLKQIVIRGKMKAAIEWIDAFLQSGEKLVVFSVHRETTFALMERFKGEVVRVIGGISDRERQAAVDRFQTDDSIRLFCGNIQAAGAGITLTAACNTVFLELPWTPGKLVQAEDRIYRIGQSQPCNIWYLVGSNTIDEDMAMMLEQKAKVLGAVLDGVPEEETSLIGELIKKLKGESK